MVSTFTIGSIGTANPGNNWPAAESPAQATDEDPATKFLLFQSSNAGLVLTPANAGIAYNRLALTTAGDAPERDPASYIIYGSTTALPTTSGATIGTSTLTLIQQGSLALTDVRNNGTTVAGPATVQFNNTTAYASYVVVFPTIKNSSASSITQIAEVKLSQGAATVPNQVAVGKARGGKLSSPAGSLSFQPSSIRQSGDSEGNNWPAGESPDHALDGDVSTKYLHFSGPDAALGVQLEGSPAVVNSVSFWTANDAPERDPATYAVYGNASATPFTGGSDQGQWILLGSGSVTLPATRNSGPVTVSVPNTVAYQTYAVAFPTEKNSPPTSLMQISEIAFANVPTATLATVSTATQSSLTATSATLGGNVTADGGATVTERGIVYALTSVNSDPLISGSGVTKVVEGTTTTGVFTTAVTGLTSSTGYSYKAYAINGVGTGYSSVGTFTTSAAVAVNAAPVAGADALNRPDTTRVAKVLKTTLLANDTDADSDTLTLTAVGTALPAGATVVLSGSFVVYTAPAVNSGNGSFTYTLSDGAGGHSVTGSVTVTQTSAGGGGTPNFLAITPRGNDFVVTFVGVPQRAFRVQYSTSTGAPFTWNEFAPQAVHTSADNGVFIHTDVAPQGPVRLYRAVPHP